MIIGLLALITSPFWLPVAVIGGPIVALTAILGAMQGTP